MEEAAKASLQHASPAAEMHIRGTWTSRFSHPVWHPLTDALLNRPNWGVLSNSLFSAAFSAWLLALIVTGASRAEHALFGRALGIAAAALLGLLFLMNVQHVFASAVFVTLPGSDGVAPNPTGRWRDEETASERLWDMKWCG